MSIQLKIKSKSLAAEARIIRHEERIAKKHKDRDLYTDLYLHRTGSVRMAARSTHLARGFIRGVAYRTIERKCCTAPSTSEILRLLEKYGTPEFRNLAAKDRAAKLNDWLNAE